MSAGGMGCGCLLGGDNTHVYPRRKQPQTAQMCHTSTPFGHFTDSHDLVPDSGQSIPRSALSTATASLAVHVFLNTRLKPISRNRLSISGQFLSSSSGAATVPPT